MSSARAKVIKQFPGVEDGEVYPRAIKVGEVIVGSLAEVAIAEKWATKLADDDTGEDEKPAEVLKPAGADDKKPEDNKVDPKLALTNLKSDDKKVDVEIPADWKTLKGAQLIDLAAKIKKSDVADASEAKAVIEAELARRG